MLARRASSVRREPSSARCRVMWMWDALSRPRAAMSKQAMGKLVEQCEAWGLVARTPDARDARARRIVFTAVGLSWLQAYRQAVAQAEAELRVAVGAEVATVIAIGLEAYAA